MAGRVDDGLRSLLHQNLPSFHWVAVETGFTMKGVPDSNACSDGVEFWVESKSCKSGWKPRIDPFQVSWHERRLRMGGRTFVAVRRRVAKEGCDDLILFHGSRIRSLLEYGMRDAPPLLRCPGRRPSDWDWKSIADTLLNTAFSPRIWKA